MTKTKITHCHFIGIGGIGMSGLARLMLDQGIKVTGSDLSQNPLTDALTQRGASIEYSHTGQFISPDTTIVYSTGIPKDNPDFAAAQKYRCSVLHRSDLLDLLMRQKCSYAVAGTHGKTTTSALLAAVLIHAGLDPSIAIGGALPQFGTNAQMGQGDHFIAEVCESDGTLTKYKPHGAIITNIDTDHLAHYGSFEAIKQVFQEFIRNVECPYQLLWCGDDLVLSELSPPGLSYGFGAHDIRIFNTSQSGWHSTFSLQWKEKLYKDITVALPGKHNVLNSCAVFILALQLGIEERVIREALESFQGVNRRCQRIGEAHSILVLDDYAHHPTEIRATLQGIRAAIGERRLVVLYQPHRYERTASLLGSYRDCFETADNLFLLPIYGAGEKPKENVTSEVLLKEIHAHGTIPAEVVARDAILEKLAAVIRPYDVIATLGAGDVTKLGKDILNHFHAQPPVPYTLTILSGGESAEHEISHLSAKCIQEIAAQPHLRSQTIQISKEGVWGTSLGGRRLSPQALETLATSDVVFPVLHGPNGEDGTIQGLLEVLGVPYIGSDWRASAIAMDKVATKRIWLAEGIPTAPFIALTRYEWEENRSQSLDRIAESLWYPLFVKAPHLGSSIGVYRVETLEQLKQACEAVLRLDRAILVEQGIQGREIECSVVGNERITVFPPGEILAEGGVYDYGRKYGPDGFATAVIADLPQESVDVIRRTAGEAYRAVGCQGMARIDGFFDPLGNYYVSEINPIPGCTAISLFPKMCEAHGLPPEQLIIRLLLLAKERRRRGEREAKAGRDRRFWEI